jgi:hypothetical protein
MTDKKNLELLHSDSKLETSGWKETYIRTKYYWDSAKNEIHRVETEECDNPYKGGNSHDEIVTSERIMKPEEIEADVREKIMVLIEARK